MARQKLTEMELIATFERAVAGTGVKARDLVVGAGDDAAIFRGSAAQDYLVTKDALVEDRHFRRQWFSGFDLGWRLAAVNLSDIAAMGGKPRFALISLVIPDNMPQRYAGDIEKGAIDHLAQYGAVVVGGNVASSDGNLVCDMTLIGSCRRGKAWRRRARAGDAIVVVGEMGAAAAGLSLLKSGVSKKSRGKLVSAYKRPVPRVAVASHLAGATSVRGAIDVSDGFSTDLIHICRASGLGCEVDASELTASRALTAFCADKGVDIVEWMLRGGDDYALILAVAPARAMSLCRRVTRRFGIPCTPVGRFTDRKGVYRLEKEGRTRRLTSLGWDHFRA